MEEKLSKDTNMDKVKNIESSKAIRAGQVSNGPKDSKLLGDRTFWILEGMATLLWLVMVGYAMFYPSTLITLGYLWFLVWVGVKRPNWLPAVLAVAIPLEVSKEFIPVFSLPERAAGYNVSLLDFFRLAQVTLGLRWFYDFRKKNVTLGDYRWSVLKKDALLWLPFLLLGVYLLSTVFSVDVKHSLGETVRLISMMLTLYLALPYLKEEADLTRLQTVLIITGSVLGVIAVGEYFAGKFFFNATAAVLINRRANATFADPNILARFLVVTFLFAVNELERQDTWRKRLLPLLAILLQGAGLGITGSRGGVLALGVATLVFALLIPKRKFTISAMLVMVIAVVVAAMVNPVIANRLESLRKGLLSASGEIREYLWRTGIAMVRDHPFFGVGVGAFGVAFTTIYPYFNPYSTFYVSLSHTAALTILAETGFVGFSVFYFLFAKTLQRGWDISRDSRLDRLRFSNASIVAGVVAILVSAQGEGRLYEEPLLWLLWAALIAVTRLANSQEEKGRAER